MLHAGWACGRLQCIATGAGDMGEGFGSGLVFTVVGAVVDLPSSRTHGAAWRLPFRTTGVDCGTSSSGRASWGGQRRIPPSASHFGGRGQALLRGGSGAVRLGWQGAGCVARRGSGGHACHRARRAPVATSLHGCARRAGGATQACWTGGRGSCTFRHRVHWDPWPRGERQLLPRRTCLALSRRPRRVTSPRSHYLEDSLTQTSTHARHKPLSAWYRRVHAGHAARHLRQVQHQHIASPSGRCRTRGLHEDESLGARSARCSRSGSHTSTCPACVPWRPCLGRQGSRARSTSLNAASQSCPPAPLRQGAGRCPREASTSTNPSTETGCASARARLGARHVRVWAT
jgi:hypothetical protein